MPGTLPDSLTQLSYILLTWGFCADTQFESIGLKHIKSFLRGSGFLSWEPQSMMMRLPGATGPEGLGSKEREVDSEYGTICQSSRLGNKRWKRPTIGTELSWELQTTRCFKAGGAVWSVVKDSAFHPCGGGMCPFLYHILTPQVALLIPGSRGRTHQSHL